MWHGFLLSSCIPALTLVKAALQPCADREKLRSDEKALVQALTAVSSLLPMPLISRGCSAFSRPLGPRLHGIQTPRPDLNPSCCLLLFTVLEKTWLGPTVSCGPILHPAGQVPCFLLASAQACSLYSCFMYLCGFWSDVIVGNLDCRSLCLTVLFLTWKSTCSVRISSLAEHLTIPALWVLNM